MVSDQYIKIWNTSDCVPRIALEKLGFSTKRNNSNTIGMFGSGIKFAPIAALRKGLDWYFVGADDDGQYTMQFVSQYEYGVECVAYNYGDYTKPSSFTVDAGILSWVDEFQIYREAISNAIDSTVDGGSWGREIVSASEIKYEPGIFAIYITASPELVKIHNEFNKYFLCDRSPIYSNNNLAGISLYESYDDSLRIYCRGVLVGFFPDKKSLYDYNSIGISLNEERNIKSMYSFEWDLSSFFSSLEGDSKILTDFIRGATKPSCKEYFEYNSYQPGSLYNEFAKNWKQAFISIYGENAVIYNVQAIAHGVDNLLTRRGYKPVLIYSDNVYSGLISAGISDYTSVVDESLKFEIMEPYYKYPNLNMAVDIASHFEPGLLDIVATDRLQVFTNENNIDDLGLTINANKSMSERKILINLNHTFDAIENIVATLIHEYDHLSTGVTDGNQQGRLFRDLADRRIGKMMMKFYQNLPHKVINGVVKFHTSKISELNGLAWQMQLNTLLDKVLIKIGDKTFLLNKDVKFNDQDVTDSVITGVLNTDTDGKHLTIAGLTNVNEMSLAS